LRRAAALGADPDVLEPLLIEALFRSERLVAAAITYRQLAERSPKAAERVGQPVVAALKDQAAAVLRALDAVDTTRS
jgi:BMFP domain-containing protein YqiC